MPKLPVMPEIFDRAEGMHAFMWSCDLQKRKLGDISRHVVTAEFMF